MQSISTSNREQYDLFFKPNLYFFNRDFEDHFDIGESSRLFLKG